MTDRRTRVGANRSSHVSACLFCPDANVWQTLTNGEKFGRHRSEGDEARELWREGEADRRKTRGPKVRKMRLELKRERVSFPWMVHYWSAGADKVLF